MTLTPTSEQAAILRAALNSNSNLMIRAGAGAAKTTSLEMIANALEEVPGLALAFNVKIKKELERRFPPNFKIQTLNSLGHLAWCKALGFATKVQLDERKLGRLITVMARVHGLSLSDGGWANVRQVVSAAMLAGIVPSNYPQKGLLPDTLPVWDQLALDEVFGLSVPELELCRAVLGASVKESFDGTISFDDQLYMPALFNGVFPIYPLVLVDEAQDLSPLNHMQIAKCSGISGRLIVVGDERQAIYAFRGADSASMAKLRSLRPDWLDLPLNTSFRCPKRIVARQLQHAPDFRAAEGNTEGEVLDWRACSWSVEELEPFLGTNSAILCRNNGPLFSVAMRLLRRGVGCIMLGRDIGKSLVVLSKKIAPHDDLPAEATLEAIAAWRAAETSRLMAEGAEHKLSAIEDRAESLLAVMQDGPCASAGELRQRLEALFASEGGLITLGSIHRAKGLEWSNILHLDPWRIPSRHARKAQSMGDNSQMQQELNLRYVVETRTKHTLILANLEDFT